MRPSSWLANAARWLPRVWAGWSLARRLGIAIGLMVLTAASIRTSFIVKEDVADFHLRQEQAAAHAAQVLQPLIAEYAILGDYASIERKLREQGAQHAEIDLLLWTSPPGNTLAYRVRHDPADVPNWFRVWTGLAPREIVTPITLGGTEYGKLLVHTTPEPTLNRLWVRFLGQCAQTLLMACLLIATVLLVLSRNLATLGRLVESAERFRRGDFATRVPPGGDPQTAATAEAFNRMADQIGQLVDSLSRSKREMHEQLHFTQELIEVLPTPVYFMNRAGVYLGVNKAWETFFARARTDIIGHAAHDIYSADSIVAQHHEAMDNLLWRKPGTQSYEIDIHAADECLRHVIYYKATFTHSDGTVAGLIATIIDITDRKRAEAALAAEKERAQVTLESIGDGVITTNAIGQVEYLNPVAQKLIGWTADAAQGRDLAQVLRLVDEQIGFPLPNPHDRCMKERAAFTQANNTALLDRSGQQVAVEISATPMRGREDQISGAVIVVRDVNASRNLARQLSWQAGHDTLTGLANRRAFEERITAAINSSRTFDYQHAMIYLDLDQFKVVNDTCGHASGDELLKQLGPLMQQHVRGVDTLARLGGDEFGVLLERCPLERAISIANALLSTIKNFRFAWDDKHFTVSASIGIVPIRHDSASLAEVLSQADVACYAAKESGRNRLHVYQQDDADVTRRQAEMGWVSRINHALETDRFVLFYQPIVPVERNDFEEQHFEVLVRMLDDSGALVSPGLFMPAAERYSLMAAIDQRVIHNTFDWLCATPTRLKAIHTCAINLSGHSLSDVSFTAYIEQKLQEFDIPSGKICFEITETAAVANLAHTRALIERLKARGCRFSLDDFGTGFSSFAYLKHLPVDYLKIDGSFVRDIVDDPIDHAMVQAINQIGHVMGIKTIAEFVENDTIARHLASIGVDYAQGYGIAAPRPIEELLAVTAKTA